ncbi:GL16670 [Drosophila persimilis]|uniref:GL16670 n=1 Tax=Drosophila persimilis TaxID=7234 RepID=B4HD81_DROPE|nr:GL16670 [Drosophila persimilis]
MVETQKGFKELTIIFKKQYDRLIAMAHSRSARGSLRGITPTTCDAQGQEDQAPAPQTPQQLETPRRNPED